MGEHPLSSPEALGKTLAEVTNAAVKRAEKHGYRKAIADLRDGDAFLAWYEEYRKGPRPATRPFSHVAADFLESRLSPTTTAAAEDTTDGR